MKNRREPIDPVSRPLVKPLVGCAGWSISSGHRPLFDAGDSALARYATRFRAVEINSSFYRPHQGKTYQRWADTVPDDFRFSVKVPGDVTHQQRLQRSGAALDRFVDEVSGLGEKLAGVLVQLPPSLQFDARVADTFFAMLRRRLSAGIACEPRHSTWFTAAAEKVLLRHRVARVAADPAICAEAAVPGGDRAWSYWRWHGSPRIYYSDYPQEALNRLAADVLSVPANTEMPWVIFDNTTLGHATANAAELQSMIEAGGKVTAPSRARRNRS